MQRTQMPLKLDGVQNLAKDRITPIQTVPAKGLSQVPSCRESQRGAGRESRSRCRTWVTSPCNDGNRHVRALLLGQSLYMHTRSEHHRSYIQHLRNSLNTA